MTQSTGCRAAGAALVSVIGTIAATSCGAAAPDPAMRPEGNGWYCWEQQGGTDKGCRRTAAECEANRERRLRFRGGVTYSNCLRGPDEVFCFSYFDKEFGRSDYTCTPESDQCSDAADAIAEDPVLKISMVNISGCAAWK
ncbi:MAG: hypothetical protein HOW73_17920 [Polyangiaceae bacterium]|nr:hypothetical protein [Polyangiaceae bacterium]